MGNWKIEIALHPLSKETADVIWRENMKKGKKKRE
jgi:hypothetical protein